MTDKINDIEFRNQTDMSELWKWFAPTSAWDDFVSEEGKDLGDRLFLRLDRWKRNH